MEKLNWIGKKNPISKKDITLKYHRNKKQYVTITVRNGKDRLLSKTGYVEVAVYAERLYFKSSSEKYGYKLQGTVDCYNKTVQIQDRIVNWFAGYHEGDYDLKYDDEMLYYYIEYEPNGYRRYNGK